MRQSQEERLKVQRERRECRIQAGLCPECGSVPSDGSQLCAFHLELNRARYRKWEDKSRKQKLCKSCAVPVESGLRFCPLCREREANRRQKPEQKSKLKKRLSDYVRGRGRFGIAITAATRKGVEWKISSEQYFDLIKNPCAYCGGPLAESGIGLDRMVSSKCYEIGNVAPCCHQCNHAKRDWFSYEEMKEFIGPSIRVVRLHRLGLLPTPSEFNDLHYYGAVPA